ncbi:uncharacterized protein CEXT_427221 [Caerostris extrusa]|uniref:Uncharacterized protein n=1 Tax=Caerostris extrusa TaxID=172846 RepID=A0AAV4RD89_CAEEX|nr:uncharacterized protein CEXT_427221 [Caerostris extrusa]
MLIQKQRRFYESAVKFLGVLLEKDNENYKKIGIFRRPDEPGPLSNITMLQQGKKFVENIVYENLITLTPIAMISDIPYQKSPKTMSKI